jgi:alkanesulfonate monooxygenase SsuD/methylene tetrahydromethanopterin reductase-like flavin-dependent oxidoreductase (luciferase family)
MPITSMNSATAREAGRRGFQPFGHSLIPSNLLANIWTTYEQAAIEAGRLPDRSDYKIARAIFLADTTEEAVRRARSNTVAANFEYIGTLLKRGGRGIGMFKRDPNMPDADCDLDYLMGEQIIAGDVDTVLERLESIRAEVGDFGTLVMMSYDWDDKDSWLRSLELFATELMPALNPVQPTEQVA